MPVLIFVHKYGIKSCTDGELLITIMSSISQEEFCCDKCRMEWWKAHPEALNKKANYECICANCGKRVIAYGNSHRKYCGQECYRAAQWGK